MLLAPSKWFGSENNWSMENTATALVFDYYTSKSPQFNGKVIILWYVLTMTS